MARWESFPGPGTRSRVTIDEPLDRLDEIRKLLEGFGPGPGASFVNVAVTERLPRTGTVQVLALPEHAPLQPVNDEPLLALAVSTSGVESRKPDEQVAPQSIPAGLEVTVPEPVPSVLTSTV